MLLRTWAFDAPCGAGTYYYCRDNFENEDLDSAIARCHSNGPIP